MSKKAVWLISIVSAVILCAAIIFLVVFLPELTAPPEEPPVVEVPISLITPEQRAAAIEIFHDGDAEGFIERTIQDFADNGIEFDFSNPEHLQYLNVPEVIP